MSTPTPIPDNNINNTRKDPSFKTTLCSSSCVDIFLPIIIFWAKTENFSQVYICSYIPITYRRLCVNCELCERDGARIISLCLVKSLSHFHVLSSFPFSNNDEQLRLTNKGSTISHNHPYCYRSPTKIYI